MSISKYTIIKSKKFPPAIRVLYHIDGLIAEDGYFHIKITTIMYDLI